MVNYICRSLQQRSNSLTLQSRQAIKNSIFLKEQDIGKAVSGWTYTYNKKHAVKTSSISLQEESIHVFT